MFLEGEIKDIIFSNVENNYTVFELKTDDGRIYTIVGYFPRLCPMQHIKVEGEFNMKTAYGIQFSAEKFWILNPTRLNSIVKFLSSGLIKNLGPITAQAIVDKFGADSLDMLQYPTEIAKVKGVSLRKAMDFGIEYAAIKKMQEAIMFMQDIGLSINMSMKIYKIYEAETINKIKQNPYILITDVNGIGFQTADKIAENLGIEKDSDYRMCAIISHVLKEAASSGNNYLPKDDLIEKCIPFTMLDVDYGKEKITNNIEDMLLMSSLMEYKFEDYSAIALAVNYHTEKSIAKQLLRLYMQAADLRVNVDYQIKQFEKNANITMHENQRSAVKESIESGVSVITGGPGTGKTTIVKCVCDVFRSLGLRVALCAPTGRAAKRLTQSTGVEAKTIHRLLNIVGTENDNVVLGGTIEQLPYDVVIIDEVSMADQFIFNSLLQALKIGARLILVGDKDQLASVGVGNILHDIIASKKFSISYLTHIYRQSDDSMIVPNAHKINNGEMPILDNKSKDFFYEEKESGQDILSSTIEIVTKRLPKYLGVKPIDIQVLCPMKKGYAGLNNLNNQLQKIINPYDQSKQEIKVADIIFRVGDKVMQMQNNYQLEWVMPGQGKYQMDKIRGEGVFNGDIGYIESINKQMMQVVIRFEDDKLATYKVDELDQLSLAYAITIHKSQGSEFDAAVISLESNYLLQSRNLLYTAVTRAKKLVVLVGTKKTIARMIANTETGSRYSLLINLLDDEARKLGLN